MTLTRPEAERLAAIMAHGVGYYAWNKHPGEDGCRNDFEVRHSERGIAVTSLAADAGDPARQAATLTPAAFRDWHRQNTSQTVLSEAEMIEWLLAQSPRFHAADVNQTLKEYEYVDFSVPFTYRYDWDGALRVAGVLQSGAVLEYPDTIYLDSEHAEIKVCIAWQAAEQDYRVASFLGPQTLQAEKTVNLEGLALHFKNRFYGGTSLCWLAFVHDHRSAISDALTEHLRQEFPPLTAADHERVLEGLREGHVWLQEGDKSTAEWVVLGYEKGNYVRRESERNIVTGAWGNPLYDVTEENVETWTKQAVVDTMESKLQHRPHLLDLLRCWA